MPRISSPNADFQAIHQLGSESGYTHPAEKRSQMVPMAFQLTSPFDSSRLLLPHSLVLHVNPNSLQESYAKKMEPIQTRGGNVEQHWPEDLTTISASGSTGAFINVLTGLTSLLRRNTIAWDRYQDLRDLYRNNGALYDPRGSLVLQGKVLLMYDRGSYLGGFRSFEVQEEDSNVFAFSISWEFRVEQTLEQIALSNGPVNKAPSFQTLNLAR